MSKDVTWEYNGETFKLGDSINDYPVKIKHYPRYEEYIPENLTHEVCKYCGSISYYH